jgi:TolB-like protein/DNA-binding winged helix-turn-helix (wHTH) protein/Tfp pilus assembly protein PilF
VDWRNFDLMTPAGPSPRLIRFGVFELDVSSGELQKQGRKIRLEGQPLQILICLLESPGELVTREELRQRLWAADTFVNFEQSLNAAVKRLRQALNDSADSPRFVETLPKRGYRFIAPVQAEPIAVMPLSRRHPRWKVYAAGLLLLSIGLLTMWKLWPASPQIHSLVVLPLQNLSGDPSQEYLSDGMTEELITDLGQIGQLRVISRTSAMSYKGTHKPLPRIARELNVDAVVEGAVLRSGERVRITAQLILAAADKHLWAKSYDGDVQDTLTFQKEVARSIADEIRVKLTPHEQAAIQSGKRVDWEAYESYLKGRYFWNKRTADGLRKSIEYFSDAVRRNPNYAQAYAGLADAYALAGDWEYAVVAAKEAYPKAKAAAAKALELDSSLAEAHISLAFCLDGFDWNWESAGKEFERGLELNPGYATGHQWYAWHLAAMGRSGEAVAELQKAENLDPLSLIIGADLAEALLIAHRYDDAIQQSRKTMGLDPFFPVAHYVLGQAYVQKRMYPQGVAELQKAIDLSPESTAYQSNLAYAYAESGRQKEARAILDNLKNRSNSGLSNAPEIALVYVGLKQNDAAMIWLEKAFKERFNPGVLLRPAFDPLRNDAKFQDLLRRIGLVR